jgi:hypothetical protein
MQIHIVKYDILIIIEVLIYLVLKMSYTDTQIAVLILYIMKGRIRMILKCPTRRMSYTENVLNKVSIAITNSKYYRHTDTTMTYKYFKLSNTCTKLSYSLFDYPKRTLKGLIDVKMSYTNIEMSYKDLSVLH